MPKVHDISFLMNQVRNIVQTEKGIEVHRDLLVMGDSSSKYGVAPRYPNEIEVDESQVRKALNDSETILKWVQGVFSAKPVSAPDTQAD